MKLIKLKEEHYIIVDDSEIIVGDWITDRYRIWQWKDDCSLLGRKKITHSTRPFGGSATAISLQEVKELIGEKNLKKIAEDRFWKLNGRDFEEHEVTQLEKGQYISGYVSGYNQALEDNKDKKYTEEQMWRMFMSGHGLKSAIEMKMIEDKPMGEIFKELLERYNPTEWEVEIVDGKLKLI